MFSMESVFNFLSDNSASLILSSFNYLTKLTFSFCKLVIEQFSLETRSNEQLMALTIFATLLGPRLISLSYYLLVICPQTFLIDLQAHGLQRAISNLNPIRHQQRKQEMIDTLYKIAAWAPGVDNFAKHYVNKKLSTAFKKTDPTHQEEDQKSAEQPLISRVLSRLGHDPKAVGSLLPDHLVISGGQYLNPEFEETCTVLSAEIAKRTSYTNVLHTKYYPEAKKNQSEVINKVIALFTNKRKNHGINGIFTSGGTMSILNLMHAFTSRCRSMHDNCFFNSAYQTFFGKQASPIYILVGRYRHPAYDKFAKISGTILIEVDCDPVTGIMLESGVRKAILQYGRKNIAVIVTSAPNYANGLFDPITNIAAIGIDQEIPVHVDSCLGGPVTSHSSLSNVPQYTFDSHPGISSISFDIHKGLEGPKSAGSIGMIREQFSSHLVHAYPTHPIGPYITPTMLGSESGMPAQMALATMILHELSDTGEQKEDTLNVSYYTEMANSTVLLTRELANVINNKVNGIRVIGDPATLVNVFAFEIDPDYWQERQAPNIHVIAEKLAQANTQHEAKYDYVFNCICTVDGNYAYHLCITPRIVQQNKTSNIGEDLSNVLNRIIKDTEPSEKPSQRARSYGYLKLPLPSWCPNLPIPKVLQEQIGRIFTFGPS